MRKIVLFCAAGMSTSILVKKMREAAEAMDYACEIDAYAISDAALHGKDADIALLGPQVRFQLQKIAKEVPCPVLPIDMSAYGTMDGRKVMEQVRKELKDA